MSTTILQLFNRASLIDLEGEDTRLVKLHEAATALAADFGAKPISKAIPALVAILRDDDRNVGAAFEGTSRAIESHWNTYQSVFRDGKAFTLYRAVALQALVEAVDSHPSLGTAIALLLRNFSTVMAYGKFAPAIQLLIDRAEWAFKTERQGGDAPDGVAAMPLPSAAKSIKFDRQPLAKRIDAAVGPHNRAGTAGESPNTYWPNQGNPWSHDFSDRLTGIIGDYIDGAMAEAAKLDAKNHQAVAKSINSLTALNPAVKRSTALLWWRQALYSESAEQSYRRLEPSEAVIHAVADLSCHLPDAYERAVDSFLSEAILALGLGKEAQDVVKFQAAATTAISALEGRLAFKSPSGLVIAAILYKDRAAPVCAPSLPPEEWAVWLLRELMAVRAVEAIEKATDGEHSANE